MTEHPQRQPQNPTQPPQQPPFDTAGAQPAYQPPQQQPIGYPSTGQALAPQEQRTLGMLSHLIPLLAMVFSAGLAGFVGSLIIYLLFKDRGDFVRKNAANSLNVQIITGIILIVSVPLMFVLIGFATYAIALVWAFVVHVIGAMKASKGELWNPPMTPQFVK